MADAADFVRLVSGNNVLDWRRAVEEIFTFPPTEREAALSAIRPVYESRLAPQFHAVPWGASLYERDALRSVHRSARQLTDGFTKTNDAELLAALETEPRTLIVFRLILGYTIAELASALQLLDVDGATRATIDALEHGRGTLTPARRAVLAGVAKAVTQVIERELFALDDALPPEDFRSRLDKIDTEEGCAEGSRRRRRLRRPALRAVRRRPLARGARRVLREEGPLDRGRRR